MYIEVNNWWGKKSHLEQFTVIDIKIWNINILGIYYDIDAYSTLVIGLFNFSVQIDFI
jgi:hypothetical protein